MASAVLSRGLLVGLVLRRQRLPAADAHRAARLAAGASRRDADRRLSRLVGRIGVAGRPSRPRRATRCCGSVPSWSRSASWCRCRSRLELVNGWFALPGQAIAGLGMGLGMSSLSLLVMGHSGEGEVGFNTAAAQIMDGLSTALLIGVGGALTATLTLSEGLPLLLVGLVVVVLVVAPRGAPGRARPLALATPSPWPTRHEISRPPGRPGARHARAARAGDRRHRRRQRQRQVHARGGGGRAAASWRGSRGDHRHRWRRLLPGGSAAQWDRRTAAQNADRVIDWRRRAGGAPGASSRPCGPVDPVRLGRRDLGGRGAAARRDAGPGSRGPGGHPRGRLQLPARAARPARPARPRRGAPPGPGAAGPRP